MKKQFLAAALVAGLVFSATSAKANGTPIPSAVGDGVEISGAVDIVFGWQHDDQDNTSDATLGGSKLGGLADFGFTNGSNHDAFRFVVNEVEIDIEKTFGENIRLRTDIDFIDLADTLGATVELEQAYVTVNVSVGQGAEWLFGRFNAPIGFDVVDNRDNWFISDSFPFRYMTPATLQGTQFSIAFNDTVDWKIAIANDLNLDGFNDSDIPSLLTRLGFTWGDEGREHVVGLALAAGPETAENGDFDFLIDIDMLFSLSDNWALAGEGVYRQTQADNITDQKAMAAFLALSYQASDAWYLAGRLDWQWEINPAVGGASTTGAFWNGAYEGTTIGATLGAGYQITDGAMLKLEYRYDWGFAKGPDNNQDSMSLLGQMAYTF